MSNPHPPPPPPRVSRIDHPHFEAAGMSLVEIYNLTSIVREKRKEGKSYREIMDYINDNNLINNGAYKISHNAIARWCRDNGLGGDMSENTEDEAINTYRENIKSLNDINTALDTITVVLDDMNKAVGKGKINVREFSEMIKNLDRLTLRRQTLAAAIREEQERIYSYETCSRIIRLVVDIVSKYLTKEEYECMMQELRENPTLLEALKKVAPANV